MWYIEYTIFVLLPYGFLLEDNLITKHIKNSTVVLAYGFLLEHNGDNVTIENANVLLPYGFLLEDNSYTFECNAELGFATIWIFARR